MNFQNHTFPEGARIVGATPVMNEQNINEGLMKPHCAPRGKYGRLVVKSGALQLVWEDDENNPLDADENNPIVIFPERLHHLVVTGAVEFSIEFYDVPGTPQEGLSETAERPGEVYLW